MAKEVQQLERVIIRFAGDSGDGMQLTGDRFTTETASFGNDLSTLPDFPAEIRAPAGTLPGVSAFQLHFADHDIMTPGDRPDVLVAMNPAALKANLGDLPRGADIIVNTDEFTKRNLARVGYAANPLEDGSLEAYTVHAVALTSMTVEALKGFDITKKEAERAKNMFALGLLSWLYNRPTEGTVTFLKAKFARNPEILEANLAGLPGGLELRGDHRGLRDLLRDQAGPDAGRPLPQHLRQPGAVLRAGGGLPAVRAAAVPRLLPDHPGLGHPARAEQAQAVRRAHLPGRGRDRRRRRGAGRGVRRLAGVTSTSGPGLALKAETIGLGVSLELPLIVVDVQRAGPSTGMPTKTEQADLLQAMFGRNGEAPVPIVAPRSPADCFDTALEAARIATTYRMPVILLSDGYLANGSEPWQVPDVEDLPDLRVSFATEPNATVDGTPGGEPVFHPYLRDPETLARPWAVPGTAGLEHRIGGIEKADGTGNISYDPANHDFMVRTRQAKIDGIAATIPPLEVEDPSGEARLLVLGWGSTYGPIGAACRLVRAAGGRVAQAHLRHLNPFPADLGDVLARYDKVLIPEMNLG